MDGGASFIKIGCNIDAFNYLVGVTFSYLKLYSETHKIKISPRLIGGIFLFYGVVKLIFVNKTIVPTLKHSHLKWLRQILLNDLLGFLLCSGISQSH